MELEEISSDCSATYFVRGHVEFQKLLDLIKAEYDEDKLEELEPVEHQYFRVRPDNTGNYSCWYYPVKTPGRGAFPVTSALVHW